MLIVVWARAVERGAVVRVAAASMKKGCRPGGPEDGGRRNKACTGVVVVVEVVVRVRHRCRPCTGTLRKVCRKK